MGIKIKVPMHCKLRNCKLKCLNFCLTELLNTFDRLAYRKSSFLLFFPFSMKARERDWVIVFPKVPVA